MLNEGLDQETAYYAADQILHVAQEWQVKHAPDDEPPSNQIPAETVDPGTITILDNLIETCKAGKSDFRIAAQNIRDQELGRLLEDYARKYEQFGRALQNQAQRLDGASEPVGSVTEGLKRGWLNIEAAMTIEEENTDLLVLAATANSEAATLKIYREALDKGLPGELRSIVEHQFAEIEEMYDHISRINTGMKSTD